MNFKFELDQQVVCKETGIIGHIVGRADYSFSDVAYLVRFNQKGHFSNSWLNGNSLLGIEEERKKEIKKPQKICDICDIKIEFDRESKTYIATSNDVGIELEGESLEDLLNEVKSAFPVFLNLE